MSPGDSPRALSIGTIFGVARHRLTGDMLNHVRALVRREIATNFPTPPGQRTNPGGQARIAKQLNMSQATLNTCFVSGTKAFSIGVILGIHAYFAKAGRPISLDRMLGLTTAGLVETLDSEHGSAAEFQRRLDVNEAEMQKLRAEMSKLQAVGPAASDRSRTRRRG
jgi:hypothetical protein